MSFVEQSTHIEAPCEAVYAVITDFSAYPEFLPDVKSATPMHETDSTRDVEFVTQIMKDITYTLRFSLHPPQGIRWHLLEGEMMQSNDGEWRLAPDGTGTKATYAIDVRFGPLVPKLVTNMLVNANLPELLRRVKARVEEGLSAKNPRRKNRA